MGTNCQPPFTAHALKKRKEKKEFFKMTVKNFGHFATSVFSRKWPFTEFHCRLKKSSYLCIDKPRYLPSLPSLKGCSRDVPSWLLRPEVDEGKTVVFYSFNNLITWFYVETGKHIFDSVSRDIPKQRRSERFLFFLFSLFLGVRAKARGDLPEREAEKSSSSCGQFVFIYLRCWSSLWRK